MNTIVALLFILSVALISGNNKEKQPCCNPTATEEFARLGQDMAFVSLHDAPEPFMFKSITGEMTSIKTPDSVDAHIYEVKPAQQTNNYIFVFHEWWGLNDYMKQEAERLQREVGAVNVIAIDLYDTKIAVTPDSAQKYVGEVQEERARAIILGAIAYAGKKANIATLGWCFGGGWSMQTAMMLGKQAVGCVMYYGMPEKDPEKLKALNCDVLGIFGSRDKFITTEIVAEFQKNMKSAKKKIETKMYDADHAFANPSNPHHDKALSADANVAVIAFLKSKFGL